MGLCLSSGGGGEPAAAAAPPKATALVLLPTGEMREYPRPAATAARVLEEAAAAPGNQQGWILCDGDKMGFEGPVPAVGAAEELRAGRIYFVLPAEARRRGLRREEVAALAVRASAALAFRASSAAGTGRRRRRAVAPLVFSPPPEEEDEVVAAYKAAPAPPAAKRRPHQRFASDLSAIPECEMGE